MCATIPLLVLEWV